MSNERKEINKDKLKALEVTLGKIEKDFGKGTIMKLGDHAVDNIQVISTGSIGLDAALRSMGLKPLEKRLWQSMQSRKPRKTEV
jgi:recombination protein RecA